MADSDIHCNVIKCRKPLSIEIQVRLLLSVPSLKCSLNHNANRPALPLAHVWL